MNIHIVFGAVTAGGAALLGSVSFDKKRGRARWIKIAFGLVGIVGLAVGITQVMWELGGITRSEELGGRLEVMLSFGRGVLLGLLTSIFLSDEWKGTKSALK